jgi:hypothetical protein
LRQTHVAYYMQVLLTSINSEIGLC